MDRETDRYVIRCNNFVTASAYAAAQEWSLHEWSWFPAYTINNGVQVFERMRDVSDKVYINLKKYETPTIDPLKEYYK